LQPNRFQIPLLATKGHFFRPFFFLCLLCFLITFFFPSTLTPHHKRLILYTTTLDNECKVTLFLSIFVSPRLTFAFCIIAPFFHMRSNGMATDIASLTPGLDAHGLRSGIGRKGLRKTWGTPRNVFVGALAFPL
jgi:hypothetical protein